MTEFKHELDGYGVLNEELHWNNSGEGQKGHLK